MRASTKQHAKDAGGAAGRANLVVLRGTIEGPVEERVLRSGERISSLEIRVPGATAAGGVVPVVWADAPVAVHELPEGEEVLVVGWVRRRFFRAGGGVQSRTEVVVDSLTATRRVAKLRAALVDAAARLTDLA